MIGALIAGILITIVLLALIGLGWDTFASGIKKGADEVGITPVVQDAIETFRNATQNVVGN
ncbi:MAG: hypothetical protein M3297_02310 [Thermoproteota archaeon]|nr:hypothetical protein [Thermoproteota archaeon]